MASTDAKCELRFLGLGVEQISFVDRAPMHALFKSCLEGQGPFVVGGDTWGERAWRPTNEEPLWTGGLSEGVGRISSGDCSHS